MAGFFKKIFGDSNEKDIRRLWKFVEQVNELEPWAVDLSDSDFPVQTARFKERYQQGEQLDDIMPEAFALVREAARRKTGMRPFDVQLLGALVLHQGRIAEMKTGEGKTLVATLPAYLNALTGEGVHIVTVNDYLARRDRAWMGPIYEFLGLSVGLVVAEIDPVERRAAYRSDVVYATNNELGFDYLRDNMVIYKDDLVQQQLHYAIVDEVDSILIDEARTPLIISSRVESQEEYGRWKNEVEHLIRKQGRLISNLLASAQENLERNNRDEAAESLYLARRGSPKNKKLLKIMKEPGVEKLVERAKHRLMTDKLVNQVEEELYYTIDETTRLADIKNKGYAELERVNPQLLKLLRLGSGKVSDDSDQDGTEDLGVEHRHYFDQLIKAYSLFERDVDYVVQDGKVVIVDEFTGRLMAGRRYSDGLHQAIEVKEGVQVQAATRTVASITFQNYFRMYSKISGMTGTAATEEEEFRKIYGMDVVAIPTNRPLIREEQSDLIYKTERAKFSAAVEEIKRRQKIGQPVLVGTVSVEKSEMLSKMLKRQGVTHEVLNAVNNAREAYIIAQAGQKGVVTISTNMAGRGTDIILGGNPEYLVKERLINEFGADREELGETAREQWIKRQDELFAKAVAETKQQRVEVLALGGLHVLGTERHESRRIDNQLRGRSGRQGDPGSSQFLVSLEDDLMRLFGGDSIASLMDRFGIEEDIPIDHPLVSRGIEGAQKKVEARNFEMRRSLLDYDDVLNQQRSVIYSQRKRVLEGENMKQPILEMIEEVVDRLLQEHLVAKGFLEEENARVLLERAQGLLLRPGKIELSSIIDQEGAELRHMLLEEALAFYDTREQDLTPETMRELERVVLLRTVDRHWMYFIDVLHHLRHEIHLQAYGQRDPLVEYRLQSADMFEDMVRQIQVDVVRAVYQARVAAAPQRRAVAGNTTGLRTGANVVGGGSASGATSRASSGAASQKQQPLTVRKVGRNDPCPCGSGKKNKKCCDV
ncbi:MAG TPA: preprotein translocase subunit SecA [Candidatus Limnocylindrales bacterium]|nr:preprotein translocase subunit SecA [Candidatus Limnocylindrales bacterium]